MRYWKSSFIKKTDLQLHSDALVIDRSSRRRLSDKYIPVRRGVISRNKGDVKRCREENVKAAWSFMATKWRCEG